jgi:phage terminase large subunit
VNEGNELFYDDYFQLNLRTTEKMIIDYNPSDAKCWIYDLPEDESIIIKSTFRDNPFLDNNTIKQIENLQYTDIELWTVYGLGERTTSRKNIYAGWTFLDEKPNHFNQYIMGLDFGFNHPTALVRVWFHEDELFIEKLIYKSYLTTPMLIDLMNELGVDKNTEIMADYARPEIIEELKLANFNVHNASKSVKKGIDNVKTFKIFTLENDVDIKMEFDNYMWKKVGDTITDEPVKLHDDIMDAVRYATYYIKQQYYNNSPMSFF